MKDTIQAVKNISEGKLVNSTVTYVSLMGIRADGSHQDILKYDRRKKERKNKN